MDETKSIAYTATKIMGWEEREAMQECGCREWHDPTAGKYSHVYNITRGCMRCADGMPVWNPTKDWAHWRKLELKMMQDKELTSRFIRSFCYEKAEPSVNEYMISELGRRVSAVIFSHQELHGQS